MNSILLGVCVCVRACVQHPRAPALFFLKALLYGWLGG